MLDIDGFYFKGYKSFNGKDGVKINQIKNINLIIGKNNSGKSSFIDILSFIYDNSSFIQNYNRIDDLIIKKILKYEELNEMGLHTIHPNISSFVEKPMPIRFSVLNGAVSKEFHNGIFGNYPNNPENNNIIQSAVKKLDVGKGFSFRRLASERNILPESTHGDNKEIDKNGNGATDFIQYYMHTSSEDEKEIEEILLEALNTIVYPDAKFKRIYAQIVDSKTGTWEVFLEEENSRGRFPLSQTGSGLKTIILILLNLITIPNTTNRSVDKYIFAFEEIENNLHPALQRRIFDYLYTFAVKYDTHIFITTHSHVAINTYSNKEDAQIIHVIKDTTCDNSTTKVIDNHIDKIKILNDLDVRASDLFQSNGIIWVEGPSDRIYIKKWIEIFSSGEYIEGNHYQFLYYGGKLLSQYELNPDENEITEFINILKINRNAVIVIDRDKDNIQDDIRETKQRVCKECNEMNIQCWITQGREIENYLTKEIIETSFDDIELSSFGQFSKYKDYINEVDSRLSNDKIAFANQIVSNITTENSEYILDLKQQIEDIIRNIKMWNPEP